MINNKTVLSSILKIQQHIELSELPTNDGLYNGKAGLILYYYWMSKFFSDAKYCNFCLDLFNLLIERLVKNKSSINSTYSFSNGIAGLGYILHVLIRENIIPKEFKKYFKEINSFIYRDAVEDIKRKNSDFMHGPSGAIYYFSLIKNRRYVCGLLKELNNAAVTTESGTYFYNELPLPSSITKLEGINLSLSHGLCGTTLSLLKAYSNIAESNIYANLIKDILRYIKSFYKHVDHSKNNLSLFPSLVASNQNKYSNIRLGWCYGDLNEAYLFIKAGKILNDYSLLNFGTVIASFTCQKRTIEETQITDTHFCHGSAGLTRFYYRIFEETNNIRFYRSCEFWLNTTIKNVDRDITSGVYAKNPCGILEGLAGVNLTMLSFIDKRSYWDDMFML